MNFAHGRSNGPGPARSVLCATDVEYNEVRARESDWSKRAGYIRDRHQIDPVWAEEAVADPESYWLEPDPASTSGLSMRVIGYSGGADAVLTVILLAGDADPDELLTVSGGE